MALVTPVKTLAGPVGLPPLATLFGRKETPEPEEDHQLDGTWDIHIPVSKETSIKDDVTRLLCEDRARHALFSLRLRKDYLLYCFICFLLAIVACTSTISSLLHISNQGQAISSYQPGPWETALEAVIGTAVITETLSTLWLSGRRAFVRDCWCVFDATVVLLTLLDWSLQLLRWALLAEGLLGIDLPLLTLRFVLQPCRMLTAVSMVRRVRNMQQGVVDVVFDVLHSAEDPEPAPAQILTAELKDEIAQHLPAWCRFREWRLTYSPAAHGTSMLTFFRAQADVGPNVLLLQTSDGSTLGGFVTEGWHTCQPGRYYYGTGDCFVFTSSSPSQRSTAEGHSHQRYLEVNAGQQQQPAFFHAKGGSEVLLWGDGTQLSLSGAISLREDFKLGSTFPSEAFGSPALVEQDHGGDFAVAAVECWELA